MCLMTRLFLFNASAVSRLYGIGNYVDIVFRAVKKCPQIHVILVDFFQVRAEEYIEVEKDGTSERFNCYFTARSLHYLPHPELWEYLNAE